METTLTDLYEYALGLRRQLHEYPEIGFDLPRTVQLVSGELQKMNITYTHAYGKGSVVAELGQGEKCIALRADMDALPVEEKTDLPYKSKIPGQMHACGHDAHTAILLAVAKYLKEREQALPCKVRLIFQPSEEGAVSGAKMLVEHGVMDGVEHIICAHCENTLESGKIGIHYGDYMAACIPVTIRFHGRTSHATAPQSGIDAVAMAVEAYGKMKATVARKAGQSKYIWSVGRLQGGHVHNVIADLCEMDISFRFYDVELAKRIEHHVRTICNEIAGRYGGSAELLWNMSTGPVHNDKSIVEHFANVAKSAGLPIGIMPQKMSSEDFGWYLTKAPGMLFRFGTRNEALGCTTSAHRNDFRIDEAGMKTAIQAFCAYVMRV